MTTDDRLSTTQAAVLRFLLSREAAGARPPSIAATQQACDTRGLGEGTWRREIDVLEEIGLITTLLAERGPHQVQLTEVGRRRVKRLAAARASARRNRDYLSCGRPFQSDGPHHRICGRCRASKEFRGLVGNPLAL